MPFRCVEIVSALLQVSLVTAVCLPQYLAFILWLLKLDVCLFLQRLLVLPSGQLGTVSSFQPEHYKHLFLTSAAVIIATNTS